MHGDTYHTGFEAHEQYEPRTANPYGNGTWDRDQWFLGWDTAAGLVPEATKNFNESPSRFSY